MRTITVGLVVLALSACTTKGMLENEPKFVMQSDKSIDELHRCLAVELSALANPTSIPNERGRDLVFDVDGYPIMIATLLEGPPTTMEVRGGTALSSRWRNKARECAA